MPTKALSTKIMATLIHSYDLLKERYCQSDFSENRVGS